MQHFMFDPSWDAGCPSCSAGLDEMSDGLLDHLAARDTAFAVVARAPFAAVDAYRKQRGWTIPMYSSFGSDFNYDFHVSLDESVDAGAVQLPRRCTAARGRASAGRPTAPRSSRV